MGRAAAWRCGRGGILRRSAFLGAVLLGETVTIAGRGFDLSKGICVVFCVNKENGATA